MQVITFKAKPKTIFGITLLVTGIVVIILTFIGNHTASTNGKIEVACSTTEERLEYIKSLGWETDNNEEVKSITIPEKWGDVYNRYNTIQKKQGFNLEEHKGKQASVYTYNITNYKDNKRVIANLIVVDGVLVGADLCDTSAKDGFLKELTENGQT